jgi:galactokinase
VSAAEGAAESAAEITWWAPGRANLIGEHTDYNDGLVLPFALDRGTLAAAARREDGLLVVRSRQASGPALEIRIDDLRPGAVTGWAAYPAGVAWALREAGHRLTGASLAIDSDLPQGAGLASSAALECAVALALSWVAGLVIPRPELAELARRAESDFVGMPCGIMDQSASLLCEAGSALLLDCRTGVGTQVPLDLAGAGLMIIDTQVRHVLADGAYATRRQECVQAARALGVASLRDVVDTSAFWPDLAGARLAGARLADARLADAGMAGEGMADAGMAGEGMADAGMAGEGPAGIRRVDPVLRRRARHVITENQRVEACAAALRAGHVAAVGALLNESHRSLRDDFEVSWPAADVAVASATAAGALGARMMGGGFGGSVIALVRRPDMPHVHTAVRNDFAIRGWPLPQFSDAVPGGGARRMK